MAANNYIEYQKKGREKYEEKKLAFVFTEEMLRLCSVQFQIYGQHIYTKMIDKPFHFSNLVHSHTHTLTHPLWMIAKMRPWLKYLILAHILIPKFRMKQKPKKKKLFAQFSFFAFDFHELWNFFFYFPQNIGNWIIGKSKKQIYIYIHLSFSFVKRFILKFSTCKYISFTISSSQSNPFECSQKNKTKNRRAAPLLTAKHSLTSRETEKEAHFMKETQSHCKKQKMETQASKQSICIMCIDVSRLIVTMKKVWGHALVLPAVNENMQIQSGNFPPLGNSIYF